MYNETNNTHASGDNDRRRYCGYLQHEQCILDSWGRNNCNKALVEYFPATACVGGGRGKDAATTKRQLRRASIKCAIWVQIPLVYKSTCTERIPPKLDLRRIVYILLFLDIEMQTTTLQFWQAWEKSTWWNKSVNDNYVQWISVIQGIAWGNYHNFI